MLLIIVGARAVGMQTIVANLGPAGPLELDDSSSLWVNLGEFDLLCIGQPSFLKCTHTCFVKARSFANGPFSPPRPTLFPAIAIEEGRGFG